MLDKLKYLAMAYFHQDYREESGTPTGVICDFCAQEDSAVVAELVRDIDYVLTHLDEAEIARLWLDEWGAAYEPPVDDKLTYRDWFHDVLRVIGEATRSGVATPSTP